ncbi:MAG TPA: DUF2807 domain-containing protein [Bacteroidia bacterium]|nr:DUF2807 domain-containing protein [Bacteroidia bacterium]
MKQSLTVFSLVLFAMLCSCNKESAPDFIQTTGEITIEERTLENFNELEVFNTINVLIVPDTVNKVVIEAGENLIPDILTTVKEGKLILKNNNKFNFLRSYKKEINIEVHCKTLIHLIYRGAGNIRCSKNITDSIFTLDCHKGTGSIDLLLDITEGHFNMATGQLDLTLHGKVGVNYIYQVGNGYTDASDLNTAYTFVTNKGTNDLIVQVSYELFARLDYLGNVYYKGNPINIGAELNDQGQLIKID